MNEIDRKYKIFQLGEELKQLRYERDEVGNKIIGFDKTAKRKRYHLQQVIEYSERIALLKHQIEILEQEESNE